ncbi:immunity 52 family protein [Burkholderia gladioli]|uniref:immunity 52 family protein n=1 Tax=Burkholderia gladioli TaxID=28095 RepID=UPI0016404F88|nr:immunity 52 family protein [Burkholderia gladioli]MBU9426419.1 immunity 52 family protein [Burkholderia gladioli]MDN8063497.1 immunity 52 family protein [Burkholderia gladioli]
MEIVAQFRSSPDFAQTGDFAAHLVRVWPVVEAMSKRDERLVKWWLKADTEEEARLYPMYEEPGVPSPAVLAVLAQRYSKKLNLPKVFGFWNGRMAEGDSATLKLAIDTRPLPGEVEIGLPSKLTGLATANGYEDVAEIVAGIVAVYDPVYVSVSSRDYFPRQVFDDKPGVGWMLYLPKVVTTQQVPEAQALIPIPGAEGKQRGTVIVSVIDAVFSVDNPDHVDVANRIEIRLVDQDLLPRYSDI